VPAGVGPAGSSTSQNYVQTADRNFASMDVTMKSTRPYTQRARAARTAETREHILAAARSLASERLTARIVLGEVAARAGVSVQTVLRHFGSKDALLEETRTLVLDQVLRERAAPPGDVVAAVTAIEAFYEHRGDMAVRMLAEEHEDRDVAEHLVRGRRVHRDWVGEVFGPQLDHAADRVVAVDLLAVATDVYTWKILRRDRGLDRDTTRERMLHLVRAVLPASREGKPPWPPSSP
jgi:AcrR family transcriptional regulator